MWLKHREQEHKERSTHLRDVKDFPFVLRAMEKDEVFCARGTKEGDDFYNLKMIALAIAWGIDWKESGVCLFLNDQRKMCL